MIAEFKVRIKIPEGMGISDMKEHILDAVSCWGKQFEPVVDPRFDISERDVKVTRLTKTGMYKMGVLHAAAIANTYNSSTTHPYRLGDCIRAKLNLLDTVKIQRNTERRT